MYTPPDKTDLHFISPCAAKLYEIFGSLSARYGVHLARSCQKATALAAATFKESTPCDIGMRTV